ncbi:MAG TPA: polysaccharide deacetylase family protein [Jiangellaceae bacterium]|nr:polysaccharide deacetylase family protein [Jiangellaceae bacterium]
MTAPTPTARPAPAAAPRPEFDSLGTRHLTGRPGRTVALTFDDGPEPTYTPQVLAILGEYGVTAMFCVTGERVREHPEIVRQIHAGGHALCNHTVTHDLDLRHRPDRVIHDEIGGALAAIHEVVPGADVTHFRAPGGYFAPNVNVVAEHYGHTPLGWSVDPQDWREPGPAAIRSHVVDAIHAEAVVLLHDAGQDGADRSGTVAALPGIIEALDELGYAFVLPAR